ncbi:hypothetical protein H311_04120 [Anncaliia algerae PRA109]|nr:hypothetical protein H311_04120 [Anncaliia algerae PRA109]
MSFDLEALTIKNIISKLVEVMPEPDFGNNKLGGPESIVQIDKSMFSIKCKSHQGRSPHNRTDSLCIFEYKERIVKDFACVIANIGASTLVSIITRNVANNSIIWTDEHRSYSCLSNFYLRMILYVINTGF